MGYYYIHSKKEIAVGLGGHGPLSSQRSSAVANKSTYIHTILKYPSMSFYVFVFSILAQATKFAKPRIVLDCKARAEETCMTSETITY